MKKIKLTHERFALVDNEDFELVKNYKWCVNGCNMVCSRIKGKFITLHRFIMMPPKDKDIDHINGNRLDNQRINLRICTRSQNCANRNSTKPNKSGYRGVIFRESSKKWRAIIRVKQKTIHLGLYFNKLEAAKQYNQAAIKYFGEFARLNPI